MLALVDYIKKPKTGQAKLFMENVLGFSSDILDDKQK